MSKLVLVTGRLCLFCGNEAKYTVDLTTILKRLRIDIRSQGEGEEKISKVEGILCWTCNNAVNTFSSVFAFMNVFQWNLGKAAKEIAMHIEESSANRAGPGGTAAPLQQNTTGFVESLLSEISGKCNRLKELFKFQPTYLPLSVVTSTEASPRQHSNNEMGLHRTTTATAVVVEPSSSRDLKRKQVTTIDEEEDAKKFKVPRPPKPSRKKVPFNCGNETLQTLKAASPPLSVCPTAVAATPPRDPDSEILPAHAENPLRGIAVYSDSSSDEGYEDVTIPDETAYQQQQESITDDGYEDEPDTQQQQQHLHEEPTTSQGISIPKGSESLNDDAEAILKRIMKVEVADFNPVSDDVDSDDDDDDDVDIPIPTKDNYMPCGIFSNYFKADTPEERTRSAREEESAALVLPMPLPLDPVRVGGCFPQTDFELPYDIWCMGELRRQQRQRREMNGQPDQ